MVLLECKARTLTSCLALELNCLRNLRWTKEIMLDCGEGCLPFAKTIRLEISGINIEQFNATFLARESL